MTAVELGSAAPTGLLERESELGTARDWLDDVRAERGRMLLIEAPAGMGKSALIEHVREMARGEFNVLSAAGSEVEQELGWGVARSLFEPWLLRLPGDERTDLLSGPATSASLLLAANGDATALPASDASFAILHGLYWLTVRAAELRPTLLVIDDAHWADEPSLRLLTYLVGRIRDQPVGLLVAVRSGESDAAGLLTHLAGDRDVTVCEPAPLSAAAITTLIREHVPEADAAFCRRRHELTAGNPLGVREVPPAGDGQVVEDLRDAARRAMAHGVPASAARYLERALREPPSDDDRAELLAELGRAEASIAPQRAIEHLEAAVNLAQEPEQRARLAVGLGRALNDAGRLEDACATFERGLAELQDDSGELATELEAWYLTAAMLVPARVGDAHRRAGAVAARPGIVATPAGRLLVARSITVLVRAGNSREQLIRLARTVYGDGLTPARGGSDARAAGVVVDQLPIEIAVAGALGYSDEYEQAEEVLKHALQAARRVGWVTWFAAGSLLRARFRLWTGPIGGVIGEGMAGLEVMTGGVQMYLPAAGFCLICGLIESDEYDEAGEVLAELERDFSPTGPLAAWQHEARGRLAAATGDWERALQAFLVCGESAEAMRHLNPSMVPWRSEAGLAALRLGRSKQARELIDAELALAARFGAPRALGVSRRAAALLETGANVEAGLADAAALFRDCGARIELAYTLLELGGAIRRAGRPTEARGTLREALAVAEDAGARRAARLAREELQRAGGRAATRTGGADQLTPSERRVAELAAQGRTNREIANELFVTVKAVEWHLGNSYRKLDIRGRQGLAAALDDGSRPR